VATQSGGGGGVTCARGSDQECYLGPGHIFHRDFHVKSHIFLGPQRNSSCMGSGSLQGGRGGATVPVVMFIAHLFGSGAGAPPFGKASRISRARPALRHRSPTSHQICYEIRYMYLYYFRERQCGRTPP
jgi:hypothetical protein